jgi:hypothetical protein
MNVEFFTTSRVAGLLMLLSIVIMLGAVVLIAAQGRLGGMAAAFRGVHPGSADASGLRTIARFAVPFTMAQLAGFALFTLVLLQAGDRGLAVVALVFLMFWSVLGAVEGSFHASVTTWAAEEAARTGSSPSFYEPLRRWLNSELQLVNMSFALTAMLLFSWSALRTGLLPEWIGWAALAWSLLSFFLYYLVLGAPLIIIVAPLLFGIGLLLAEPI